MSELDLTKSSGFDGILLGATTKGTFLTKIGADNLVRAAVFRVLRLNFLGPDAGLLTRQDKYLAGVRSIVVPQIKRELHDAKKVLVPKLGSDGKQLFDDKGGRLWEIGPDGLHKMLENPRWRSILIQGVVDHVAAQLIFKRHQKALCSVVQNKVPGFLEATSGIGFSSNDAGVQRVLEDLQAMRDSSEQGDLVTSDVTGMDFSLGGLALVAVYHATSHRSRDFNRAALAYAYCEADPMYLLVDRLLYTDRGATGFVRQGPR